MKPEQLNQFITRFTDFAKTQLGASPLVGGDYVHRLSQINPDRAVQANIRLLLELISIEIQSTENNRQAWNSLIQMITKNTSRHLLPNAQATASEELINTITTQIRMGHDLPDITPKPSSKLADCHQLATQIAVRIGRDLSKL